MSATPGPPPPPSAADGPAGREDQASHLGRGAGARRPLVERVGMAGIAAVVATLFGGVAAASFSAGEPFLAVMAALGALMTAWVGLLTLLRG